MFPGKCETSPCVAFGQQWFCGSLHVVWGPFVTSWLSCHCPKPLSSLVNVNDFFILAK